ncbi:MAG: HD domain-containing protein [Candidatus Omnitrophica bacterium]|nr:HD domain-containing protein [Candidatus Omnitrophota bacterium]
MSERESLILSALLHDIGKFAQRGDEKLREEYDKKVRDIYCPSTIGYSHLLYSAQFIKEFFKNKESLIENLVLSHHKPEEFTGDKRLSKIIQISDWLSSGEREKREDESKIDFKKEPIISIFSQLNIEGGKSEELFNKPVKIDGDLEVLRPVKKDLAISNEYNFPKLWKEFKNESGNISYSSSFEKIFTQIFSLLEKYTIFIPSASVKDRPEISLFHHLKSTCAIATCLYDLSKTEDMLNEIIDELESKLEEKRVFPHHMWMGLRRIPDIVIASIGTTIRSLDKMIRDLSEEIAKVASTPIKTYETEVVSSVRVRSEDLKIIDQLVEGGVFKSRSEAVSYFTRRGLECSREWIEKALEQIKRIKEIQDSIKRELEKEKDNGEKLK